MAGRARGLDPAAVVGILLVVIGAAFLLRTTGVLRIDWGVLLPLLLIMLGVLAVAGALNRRQEALHPPGAASGARATQLRVPREGARRLELVLRLGAGRYQLSGGSDELVEVMASDDTIEASVDRRGEGARVRVAPSAVGLWPWAWRGAIDWRLAVATDVPTSIDLQAGAGEFDLDLSAVDVADAGFQVGAARLRIALPRPRGDLVMRVEGGAAAIILDVPPGLPFRVDVTGLVSVSGPRETPGYATARDRVTVRVSGGAASLEIVAR
jgi:hypothetical protein